MKWLFSKTNKRKKLTIEFCENNLDRFLKEDDLPLFKEFLSEPHITYKEYDCQSHCKLCKKNAYAIVNGELVTEASSRELLNRLKEI
ncbi:MAG TPA: DUF1450 domain-containing protein [Bacillus sp. (in: firmicutes)]|uniref:DUF1450 domain-containing protein n=1 Tax=Bacillus litorisediminis TaxID=2922713 RepID=UPI001FAB68C0|nr:DUF1450 domain-containing protein [Bacillus litorisediminis]HWO75255.1 DUF1450 domain-containing protein [Bacillus sp. (in: firmicutes)]